MNINVLDRDICCGCTACMSICSTKAISMISDQQGFYYPEVDQKICIDCGKCVKVCSDIKKNELFENEVFAVKHKDLNIRRSSSSGGFSHAISEKFLKDKGIVYGVSIDNHNVVIEKRISTLKECRTLQGSKYVQAFMGDTFSNVKDDLISGEKVLFIATSCHVNGLVNFLKLSNVNIYKLVTVDLICHGVPSPLIYKDYINYISKNKEIKSYECRTKFRGWGDSSRSFCPSITYQDGKVSRNSLQAWSYIFLFFSNNCLRPNCYNCPFIGINSPADFTIADYWGLKKVHPDFFDKFGVSLVCINTKKGKDVFSKIEDIETLKSSYEKASKFQGNMNIASLKSNNYDRFWKDYFAKDFKYIMKKYGRYNIKGWIRLKLVQSNLYGFYKNSK